MTAITVTAAQVSLVYPEQAEVRTAIATEALTKGVPVYIVASTGKMGIADANDNAKREFQGIAMTAAAADQAFDRLVEGYVIGYDLSGVNYGDLIYLSDAAGIADVSGSNLVVVGRVEPVCDGGTLSKVLHVEARTVEQWNWGI